MDDAITDAAREVEVEAGVRVSARTWTALQRQLEAFVHEGVVG